MCQRTAWGGRASGGGAGRLPRRDAPPDNCSYYKHLVPLNGKAQQGSKVHLAFGWRLGMVPIGGNVRQEPRHVAKSGHAVMRHVCRWVRGWRVEGVGEGERCEVDRSSGMGCQERARARGQRARPHALLVRRHASWCGFGKGCKVRVGMRERKARETRLAAPTRIELARPTRGAGAGLKRAVCRAPPAHGAEGNERQERAKGNAGPVNSNAEMGKGACPR